MFMWSKNTITDSKLSYLTFLIMFCIYMSIMKYWNHTFQVANIMFNMALLLSVNHMSLSQYMQVIDKFQL